MSDPEYRSHLQSRSAVKGENKLENSKEEQQMATSERDRTLTRLSRSLSRKSRSHIKTPSTNCNPTNKTYNQLLSLSQERKRQQSRRKSNKPHRSESTQRDTQE